MSSYWDFLPTRLLTRNTFPEAALDLLQSKAMVRPVCSGACCCSGSCYAGARLQTQACPCRPRQRAAPGWLKDNGLAPVRRRKRTQSSTRCRQQRPWRARA